MVPHRHRRSAKCRLQPSVWHYFNDNARVREWDGSSVEGSGSCRVGRNRCAGTDCGITVPDHTDGGLSRKGPRIHSRPRPNEESFRRTR